MTARNKAKRYANGDVLSAGPKHGEAEVSSLKGRSRRSNSQQAEGSAALNSFGLDHTMTNLTIQGTDEEGSDDNEPGPTRKRLPVRPRQKINESDGGEGDGEDDANGEEDEADGSGSDENEDEDASYGGGETTSDEEDDNDSTDVDKTPYDEDDEDEESEYPRRRTRARRGARTQNSAPAKKRRIR